MRETTPHHHQNQVRHQGRVVVWIKVSNIDPVALRSDNFEAFFQARHTNLLNRIEKAMGKPLVINTDLTSELESIKSSEYDE